MGRAEKVEKYFNTDARTVIINGTVKDLQKILDVNDKFAVSCDTHGNTPLHTAAFHGEAEKLQILIDDIAFRCVVVNAADQRVREARDFAAASPVSKTPKRRGLLRRRPKELSPTEYDNRLKGDFQRHAAEDPEGDWMVGGASVVSMERSQSQEMLKVRAEYAKEDRNSSQTRQEIMSRSSVPSVSPMTWSPASVLMTTIANTNKSPGIADLAGRGVAPGRGSQELLTSLFPDQRPDLFKTAAMRQVPSQHPAHFASLDDAVKASTEYAVNERNAAGWTPLALVIDALMGLSRQMGEETEKKRKIYWYICDALLRQNAYIDTPNNMQITPLAQVVRKYRRRWETTLERERNQNAELNALEEIAHELLRRGANPRRHYGQMPRTGRLFNTETGTDGEIYFAYKDHTQRRVSVASLQTMAIVVESIQENLPAEVRPRDEAGKRIGYKMGEARARPNKLRTIYSTAPKGSPIRKMLRTYADQTKTPDRTLIRPIERDLNHFEEGGTPDRDLMNDDDDSDAATVSSDWDYAEWLQMRQWCFRQSERAMFEERVEAENTQESIAENMLESMERDGSKKARKKMKKEEKAASKRELKAIKKADKERSSKEGPSSIEEPFLT